MRAILENKPVNQFWRQNETFGVPAQSVGHDMCLLVPLPLLYCALANEAA